MKILIRKQVLTLGVIGCLIFAAGSTPARASDGPPASPVKPDRAMGERIVDSMEERMRGTGSVGEMEMFIQRWNRTMRMKFWEKYPDRSLVRITSPAEDAGVGSLKLGKDLWTYNPKIDQVQKVPPSLMLDSWMGSDFTNDDVSRASSLRHDYDPDVPEASEWDATPTWRVPLIPKPSSPVVWEKVVIEVARDDHRPLRQEYYDETGKLARYMVFSDYRKLDDGRTYPFRWRMESLQDKGRYTEIRVHHMSFQEKISDSVFSIRALKRAR